MIMLLRYNYPLEGHIKVNEETSSKPLETSQHQQGLYPSETEVRILASMGSTYLHP
jgi:hypothetical protein